jgi:hypothetical protein
VHRAPARFSPRARRGVAILTALALAAGLAGLTSATAATTVASPETNGAGQAVVRDDSTTLAVDTGGRIFSRLTGAAGFAAQSTLAGIAVTGCLGDNPAGTDRSPRSRLVVTDPAGEVVLDQTSPARNLLTNAPSPTPGNSNYLGGPWSTTVSLAGRPAGVYTVNTIITDRLRTGALPSQVCLIGTPGTPANTFVLGTRTETTTFEYRPWQAQFADLLGTGTVRLNTVPEEFRFGVSGASSPVVTGAAAADAMKLYSVPDSFEFQLSLPNPGACGTDPLACLPTGALSCNPGTGCRPRLATINYDGGADKLVGLFDLETRAFAAVATTGGRTRLLVSGGTAVDGFLQGLLDQLNGMAAQLGIDLPALLGTTLDLNLQRPDGSTDVIRISLLRAIELFNMPNGPATGVGLVAPLSLGAGVILHTGAWLAPADPTATAPDGTPRSGFHYTVTEATALPAVPSLPVPLNALVAPGKLKHVSARVPAGSGSHSVVLGADTESDPVTGLPVHLPLLSTPGAVADSGIDFVGTATVVTVPEQCLAGFCFGGGFMLGTGVATFGTSPLPVDFASLPLVWGDELGLGSVMAPVDGLVAQIAGSLLSNPAVTDLLGNLPLADVLGGGLPGGDVLGDLPLGDLPLGDLPLGDLPLGSLLGGGLLGGLPLGGLLGNLPLLF